MDAVHQESTAALPRFRRVRGWLRFLGWAALVVVFFSPARTVLDVTLDGSNYGSYSAFPAEHRQYGTDVIPMAGPYGFLMYGTTYSGHLYWPRFTAELLVKSAFAGLVIWFFSAASRLPAAPGTSPRRRNVTRWIWLVSFLAVIPDGELVYDLTVMLAGLFLVLNLGRDVGRVRFGAVVVLLAFLALTKGTLLVFAGATLGLAAILALATGQRRALGEMVLVFGVAFLGFWIAAGQKISHLPAYLRGISELSRGYNEAMGLAEPDRLFAGGVLCLALLLLGIGTLAWIHRRQPAVSLAAVLLTAFAFLEWKHGFVRADGHVYLFFFFVTVAATTLWIIDGVARSAEIPTPGRSGRIALTALIVAAGVLSYYAPAGNPLSFLAWQSSVAASRTVANARALAAPRALQRRLDAELADNRTAFSLPETRGRIADRTVDFFGIETGYIPLNGMNLHPRPMSGGSFNVFTPYLQERNAAFIGNPATRPAYYLAKLETIDHRLLPADDASALRELVHGYEPVAAEESLLVLAARPDATAAPAPRQLGTRPVVLGQSIPVPAVGDDEILLVSFQLPSSLAGRVRSALYKPSMLFIDLEGTGIREPHARRLVPSLVTRPVMLSPLLESTEDLLTLYSHEHGKTVTAFTLNAEIPGGFNAAGLSATFFAAPRPAPLDAARRDELAARLHYPMANRTPVLLEPAFPMVRTDSGNLVQRMETPSRIEFALRTDDRAVTFDYGLDAETYGRGRTDGVEFAVELQPPAGPTQVLYRHLLQPLTHPSDRGRHRDRVVLPPAIKPGSRLILQARPGPKDDTAWDWAYYAKIRFESGPFDPDQFPAFNVRPVEVDAEFVGALKQGDGTMLFMLNSRGRLTFALSGVERRLTFTGGLLSGAYTDGNTDGVEFAVVLHRGDGSTAELYRRWLQPKSRVADRGLQEFVVDLPAHAAGDRLDVLALPGPNGDLSWDWSYLKSLTLE